MDCLLFRTGSGSLPVQTSPSPSPHRHSISLPIQDSVSASACAGGVSFAKISLQHADMSRRSIRRALSEPDLTRSSPRNLSNLRSPSFTSPPTWIPEDDEVEGDPKFPGAGGGVNKNHNSSGGSSNGDDRKIGDHYQELLRTNPTSSLLLRNYGKYLHEVEKDAVKAEEYYGRAILASPGDGELLSLYAQLTWETQRDKARAHCYFNQALQASPNDCTILGSYAHFLWEAEEESEEGTNGQVAMPAMVGAF